MSDPILDALNKALGQEQSDGERPLTSIDSMLEELLNEPTVKISATKPTSPDERSSVSSLIGKGFGYGVLSGMANMPSTLSAWLGRSFGYDASTPREALVNPALGAAGPLGYFMGMSPVLHQQARGRADEIKTALRSKTFTPEQSARMRQDGAMVSGIPGMAASGVALKLLGHKNAPDVLAAAPDVIGQIAGELPASGGAYGAAAKLTQVAKAQHFTGRLARHMGASSLVTSAQSYLIQVRDGESDWMRVVRDIGLNAAFETVGLPGLRKAWRAEAGREADRMLKDLGRKFDLPDELTELKITQIRAGAGVHEPGFAQAIVDQAKQNPKIRTTPIVFQAKKALDDYWNKVVPAKVTVDRSLGESYGVSFDVEVDGQIVAQQFGIKGSKTDLSAFSRQTDRIASRITELSEQGHAVRLTNVKVSQNGAYSRFLTRLRGDTAIYGKRDARELTAYERSLGAAPRGTLAESGTTPVAGTKVTVSEPGKPRVVATVNKVQPESASQVAVSNPATGEVKLVPKNQVQVWMFEKRAPTRLAAHSNGDDRHFTVDLNAKEAFLEPVDADAQNNWFKTELFTSIDREGGLSNQPRGFIHGDGSLTLSLTKGQRLTTVSGIETDLGPLDLIEGARQRYPAFYRTPAERSAHSEGFGEVVQPARRSSRVTEVEMVRGPKGQMKYVPKSRVTSITPSDVGPGSPHAPFVHKEFSGLVRTPGQYTYRLLPNYPDPKPVSFRAGMVPRRMDDEVVSRDPFSRESVTHAKPISRLEHVYPGPELDEEQLLRQRLEQGPFTAAARGTSHHTGRPGQHTRPSVRARVGTPYGIESAVSKDAKRLTPDPTRGMYAAATEFELPSRYAVPRAALVNDPALIDARNAARILLEQKNVDPGTRVRVVVSDTIHASAHDAPFDWSLEELSQLEPGLYPMDEIRSGALRRGFRAFPEENGVLLRSLADGGEYKFPSRLEAASFLQKQRIFELGPKLEAEAEQVLRAGWMSSFDGRIDGGDFTPREAQEVALNAVVQNQRAGVKLWVADEFEIKQLQDRALAAKDPKVSAKLTEEWKSKSGLPAALTELEGKLQLPSGTFKAFELGAAQQGKRQVFVYNTEAVERVRQAVGSHASKLLKVDTSNPENFIRGLASREAGLDVLTSPDPHSAVLYAHFKNNGLREQMLMGQAVDDQITGRAYRVYPPELKMQVFAAQPVPAAPGAAPAGPQGGAPSLSAGLPPGASGLISSVLDPDEVTRNVELKDLFDVPRSLNYDGAETGGRVPIIEPLPIAEGDGAKWRVGISERLKTRPLLFQKLQHDTGVPFHDNWVALEHGREKSTAAFAPLRTVLDKLYFRVKKKSDREDVQTLFESIAAGKSNLDLMRKMDPKHVAAAEELHTAWRAFTESMGFTQDEMRAFFAEFPKLRTRSGDFKAYVGSKTGLPRMTSFLRTQLESDLSPIPLTERELDFHSLGVRMSRMIAYEKHLRPVYNDVMEKMEGYAKTSGMPPHIFSNFKAYAEAVTHTPDDVQIALNITAQKTLNGLSKQIRKVLSKVPLANKLDIPEFRMNEKEIVDVTSALASVNYAANLAWNTASWTQQWMQILTTGAPFLGSYTKDGIKFAARWLRDPVLREDMAIRGIAGRATLSSPLGMLEEHLEGKGKTLGTASRGLGRFIEWGTAPFQTGDDFGRVAAYMGKYMQVKDHATLYVNGKMGWEQFVQKTKLDLQDWTDGRGPMVNRVKQALDERGDVQLASDIAAKHFMQMSMFMYSRGNNARVLDGSVGRLLGMYGTYPIGLVNMFTHIANVGDKRLTKNKIVALGTLLAVNEAVAVAANEVFGADAERWMTWNGYRYRGGPYAEAIWDIGTVAARAGQDSPEAAMAWSRLKRKFGLPEALPASRGVAHVKDALLALTEGDWQAAGRSLIGLPASQQAQGTGVNIQ